MKKSGKSGAIVISLILFGILLISLISFSFVSASWFSDFWGKITGNAVTGNVVVTEPVDGLMAYYQFEGDASDASGNGHNGAVYGANCNAEGKTGKACSFDGINDYIDLGYYNISQKSFSFIAWINVQKQSPQYGYELFGWDEYPSCGIDFGIRGDWVGLSVGKLGVWAEKPSREVTGSVLTQNQWVQVALVYDISTSTIKGYLNGKEDFSQSSFSAVVQCAKNLRLGNTAGNVGYFNGSIDEVRLYSRTLSANEVKQLYDDVAGNQTYTSSCDDISCKLYEGDQVNPLNYSIEISYISSNSVVLLIETNFTSHLNVGNTYSSGGITIKITNIGYSSRVGVPSYVEFSYKPVQQTICTDSDGGLNYYVRGGVTISSTSDSSGGAGYKEDYCTTGSNLSNLMEFYCINSTSSASYPYFCPNGCLDGACVNNTIVTNKNVTSFGTYNFFTGDYIIIDDAFVKVLILEVPTCADDNCAYLVNRSVVRFYYVTKGGSSYNELSAGEEITLLRYDTPVASPIKSNVHVNVLNISINRDGSQSNEDSNSNSAFIVVSPVPQVCQSLIDKVKTPVDFVDNGVGWSKIWNNTYRNQWWIDNQLYDGTEYYAEWYTYYNEKYYNAYYDVAVFDDENVDLESWLEQRTSYEVCQVANYWSTDGNQNKVYICNWDVLNNKQDIDSYGDQNRQVIWTQGNVIVQMNLYWGEQLTNEQVSQLQQQKLYDFLEDISNNQYEYVSWDNFEIPYPLSSQVEKSLTQCPSEISLDTCSPCWKCKIEPIICPEYGTQKKTCVDNCCGKQNIESTQSCSPGECSGCYTPRWFGSQENKCIPYGFRVELESGYKGRFYEKDIIDEFITESGIDATFEIKSDGLAYININSDIDILNISNGEIASFVYVIDGASYYGKAGESLVLYPGKTYSLDITYYDSNGAGMYSESGSFEIGSIFYSEDASKRYMETINKYNYNAYCDIDGWVKQQKTKDPYTLEWAKCQNNYECFSNLCSGGECVEIQDIADEANFFKATFVKVICKLAHLFDIEDYNQCVYNYLGEVVEIEPSSGGGGGSSSGESPPVMPS